MSSSSSVNFSLSFFIFTLLPHHHCHYRHHCCHKHHYYDGRHLYNFFLLFASNVENLIAFMLGNFIPKKIMHPMESFLGVLYLYFVVKNLLWFIKPLSERKEYSLLLNWMECKVEEFMSKCWDSTSWLNLARRSQNNAKSSSSTTGEERSKIGVMKKGVLAATRFKKGKLSWSDEVDNYDRKRHTVNFQLFQPVSQDKEE